MFKRVNEHVARLNLSYVRLLTRASSFTPSHSYALKSSRLMCVTTSNLTLSLTNKAIITVQVANDVAHSTICDLSYSLVLYFILCYWRPLRWRGQT